MERFRGVKHCREFTRTVCKWEQLWSDKLRLRHGPKQPRRSERSLMGQPVERAECRAIISTTVCHLAPCFATPFSLSHNINSHTCRAVNAHHPFGHHAALVTPIVYNEISNAFSYRWKVHFTSSLVPAQLSDTSRTNYYTAAYYRFIKRDVLLPHYMQQFFFLFL